MSGSVTVGTYQPGRSVLHRLPAGLKLVGLMALSIATIALRGPIPVVLAAATALTLALVARVPLRLAARSLRIVLVVALVAAALQWWWYGGAKAIETLLDLLALALFALTLTVTTPISALLDAVLWALRPLRRLGVRTERIALAVSLAIRALPGTVDLARETRDAARARGLERHPRAYLTPFVIRVVGHAHLTGDALAARGLGDDDLG
ncbi:energy-coupling factor transporter transmembrane protein EcfT [Nocardioides sp. GXZ039]|uniref:energy-coupling factor transporter transmembrane protein EcfT n=1 Tax=Nocardioides sp. GXZ039 TaxID=3136018 RepID=UPI0030F3B46C